MNQVIYKNPTTGFKVKRSQKNILLFSFIQQVVCIAKENFNKHVGFPLYDMSGKYRFKENLEQFLNAMVYAISGNAIVFSINCEEFLSKIEVTKLKCSFSHLGAKNNPDAFEFDLFLENDYENCCFNKNKFFNIFDITYVDAEELEPIKMELLLEKI
jgi:hypothetical protein